MIGLAAGAAPGSHTLLVDMYSSRSVRDNRSSAILTGTTPVLDRCRRRAVQRLWGANLADDDRDFLLLRGIDSKTDALLVGTERRHGSGGALARTEPDILAATEWAKPIALPLGEQRARRFC